MSAQDAAPAAAGGSKSEFAKRNPHLEKLVPDAIEGLVDKLLPDNLEAALDRGVLAAYNKYQNTRTDVADGVGEVAGVLWRVVKHAYEKFHFGDLVFGVYNLALHHSTVNAMDSVEGAEVKDAELIKHLIWATDAANAAYLPTKAELLKATGVTEADVLRFEPQTTPARPAYAVWVDKAHKRVVFGFRGTTDLNDMLTDACASCEPYCGGYAHWGMHEAASWFVKNELPAVVKMVQERPGYELLLVGHSLGAGTAAMLAHMMANEPKAKAAASGIKFSAVGVATPAVLTQELADTCSEYITSVVLMHDLVPRFSIHNVFSLKEEMDATDWGTILLATAKDWAVPDVIEKSETYQKFSAEAAKGARSVGRVVADGYLKMQSAVVSGLHFMGAVKPNPNKAKASPSGTAGEAASATAATAKVALGDPEVLKQAVESVGQQMANVAKSDVHKVYAPGRIFFIKRQDKHKGRAKYGNTEHMCKLCEDPSAVPPPDHHHDAAAAADGAQAGAAADAEPAFTLIEAAPKQRFERIVLRESCLVDHLTGGYVEGLRAALAKVADKKGSY